MFSENWFVFVVLTPGTLGHESEPPLSAYFTTEENIQRQAIYVGLNDGILFKMTFRLL